MKRTMTLAVLAFLLVPAFALAGLPTPEKDPGERDAVTFGTHTEQGDKVVVPIIIKNDEPVTAIDIPLKFGKAGDAITLDRVEFPDDSRVGGFDFKFFKQDNDAKTVLIGLVSSAYDLKADMQPGGDAVAYLHFTVNKERLGEFVIELDNSRAPQHTLMLIQNRDVAGGGKEVVDYVPEFTKGNIKLGQAAGAALPKEYSLRGNYPNPFNAKTIISFALPKDSRVSLDIYNILGQKVRTLVDGPMTAGYKNLEWDGTDVNGLGVSSGVYLYKLKADEFQRVNRMTLVK